MMDAEVIVTTMVQFSETVIGCRSSSLQRFHDIVGSVVILDGVQSIGSKHWQLIHNVLRFLAWECESDYSYDFHPTIILKKEEVFELFDRKEKKTIKVILKKILF
jgi:CRISPR-associated endonuclease/helicase Cas3